MDFQLMPLEWKGFTGSVMSCSAFRCRRDSRRNCSGIRHCLVGGPRTRLKLRSHCRLRAWRCNLLCCWTRAWLCAKLRARLLARHLFPVGTTPSAVLSTGPSVILTSEQSAAPTLAPSAVPSAKSSLIPTSSAVNRAVVGNTYNSSNDHRRCRGCDRLGCWRRAVCCFSAVGSLVNREGLRELLECYC